MSDRYSVHIFTPQGWKEYPDMKSSDSFFAAERSFSQKPKTKTFRVSNAGVQLTSAEGVKIFASTFYIENWA